MRGEAKRAQFPGQFEGRFWRFIRTHRQAFAPGSSG